MNYQYQVMLFNANEYNKSLDCSSIDTYYTNKKDKAIQTAETECKKHNYVAVISDLKNRTKKDIVINH
jgi:hypothetical protein